MNDWISHAPAMNRTPDSKLRPTPGGQNDGSPNWNDNVDDWNGIVEVGNDCFAYVGGNDYHKHLAETTVYINEDGQKPHKMWIKIKTHGLRKPTDTNESFKERIRKHANKVSRSWIKTAKDLHDNPEINEVGNSVSVAWREAFHEALKDPTVQAHLADCGEAAMADPVNFTPRVG